MIYEFTSNRSELHNVDIKGICERERLEVEDEIWFFEKMSLLITPSGPIYKRQFTF